MANPPSLILLGLLALSFSLVLAVDQSTLQDFCVADPNGQVLVNGLVCKDPKLVEAEDFFFSGLHMAGNTSNQVGSKVSPVFAAQVPGLNTLGISLARIDIAPWGINPPHLHPRATEILTVLEGQIEVGFVTSNPENRFIRKLLQKSDVFVFPIGLIHYQKNVGGGYAVAIAALSSQNPGAITIASAVFGSNPNIPSKVLARAFQLEDNVVSYLQHKF
ncbi:putative germin-like protein 2-1 [Prosopis cineraria]|uniref:putative germin-like protein 2-1 n=1 Tax=Prosopis cineraria TaxID=364024 RepID=UPI00240EDB5C|nr:putative germin-like protein 2-1 [Prosopis cineraria]